MSARTRRRPVCSSHSRWPWPSFWQSRHHGAARCRPGARHLAREVLRLPARRRPEDRPLGQDRRATTSCSRRRAAASSRSSTWGPSTEGNPFLLVIISSPANLAKLERLREVNAKLSDPRGLAGAGGQEARGRGQGGHLPVDEPARHRDRRHADGAGAGLRPGLARRTRRRSASSTTSSSCMVPSLQPGRRRSWSPTGTRRRSARSTRARTCRGSTTSTPATTTTATPSRPTWSSRSTWRRSCSATGSPQAYVDHHHMGSYGARIYVPPYAEPIRPLADPLDLARAQLVRRAHGLQGGGGRPVGRPQHGAVFGLGPLRLPLDHAVPQHRRDADRVGEREAGDAALHPPRPAAGRRRAACPAYEAQTTFPNPWPGGWWRLRDIVERQKISAWATARPGGAQPGDRAVERLPEGEAADRARRRGQACRLRDPGGAARSADRRRSWSNKLLRPGHRGPAGRRRASPTPTA